MMRKFLKIVIKIRFNFFYLVAKNVHISIYCSTGRKKKIHSPLQYPRVLQLGNAKYDICAVMIHEGPNADCGHYYDLIKHPGTGQWFTYNDEVGISFVLIGGK